MKYKRRWRNSKGEWEYDHKPIRRHPFVTTADLDARTGRGRCVECGAPEAAPIHDPNLEKIQTVPVENHPLTKAGQGRSNRAQILLAHLETLRDAPVVGVVAKCPDGHEVHGATEVLRDIFGAAGFCGPGPQKVDR